MRYFNWLAGSKCGSCAHASTCTDHQKEVCPGPGTSKHVSSVPSRTRLGLETLESREMFSANPIVAENLLPGTPQSQWDVGTGDPSIQGFATDFSVDQGQTVSFKINVPSLAPYHIDIYRIGYYQGLGARKITTIPSSQTLHIAQPAPMKDLSTGLVDAGNWLVSASWAVPQTATSGVYFAVMVREDTGGGNHIPFVVRDDDGGSDVLFQTSDTTWQAYNRWGGYSLYSSPSSGSADNPNGLVRAYKVSYNRPFTTRSDTPFGRDYLFGPEFAMIGWLEQNGYNVSYFSGMDSDRHGSELLEHKVFLSVGHDEYWSGNQRMNVEAARDAGVNMMFLSGNEIYWKTRWESSIDSSQTPYRTLVTYKETIAAAKIDPSPEWTGTWRDPRFRSPDENNLLSENALTGQIFVVNRGPGGETGTPFDVPYEYSDLRFWRNTSVADLQPGQTATLGDIVLGYEWDIDRDSDFRPDGLIQMSSTTQYVPEMIDDTYVNCPLGGAAANPSGQCASCGCTVAAGLATHNLTLYRAESGALVFGAGTVQWSYGLFGMHDGPQTSPSLPMQQATLNTLADMGVQAGSIQAGLVQTSRSTDLLRPTSTITSPLTGTIAQTGVPVMITGMASDGGGGVVGGVEVSTDGGLTWRRATGRNSWSYTWIPTKTGQINIKSRAADDSGNIEIPGTGVTVNVSISTTSTAGLVAAYNFNAGSGTTLTDNVGSNNGTISGATWSSNGRNGSSALQFNGINDWVTIPDANALDLTAGMTLEAWVKPTTVGNWNTVLYKETPGGLSYGLYSSDTLAIRVGGWVLADRRM